MEEIKEILETRGSNYGDFETFSNLSQTLYGVILKHHNDVSQQRGSTNNMPPFMLEALRMICHKLARVANGNPLYKDSWVDISGYATLVVELLETIEARGRERKLQHQAALAAAKEMGATDVE